MLSNTDLTYEEMWQGRQDMYVHKVTCPDRLNFMYFVVRGLLDSFSIGAKYENGIMEKLSESTKRDCENWERILKMIKAKAIVMNVTFDHSAYKKYQNMQP